MGELAEPWSSAAERAGVRQTYRGIGDAAGVSHVTVRRLVAEGRTTPATIRKVARALRVDSSKVYEWADVPVSDWGPWDPPLQAHHLNPRARAALEELILAITEGGQQDGRTPEAEKTTSPVGRPQSVRTGSPAGGAHEVTHDEDPDLALAAWDDKPSRGERLHEEAQQRGEESQDAGHDEPA